MTECWLRRINRPMSDAEMTLNGARVLVVGSLGGSVALAQVCPSEVRHSCDMVEIRLDLLDAADVAARPWLRLAGVRLLFTARRHEEGGAGRLTAVERMDLLRLALDDAAIVDIEVASIGEMAPLLGELKARDIPWVASWHDFDRLPETEVMADAARRARDAGAAVFKAAARLHGPSDLARLAEFQLADHGIPTATMGMGPLATVSRLLCAQCGSVLNYGYLGETATAPGQWPAGALKEAIARLEPVFR